MEDYELEGCRSCGVFCPLQYNYLRDLFADENKDLLTLLNTWGLHIENNDGLPQYICTQCILTLTQFSDFLNTCLEVQESFRNFFQKKPIQIKEEIEDIEVENEEIESENLNNTENSSTNENIEEEERAEQQIDNSDIYFEPVDMEEMEELQESNMYFTPVEEYLRDEVEEEEVDQVEQQEEVDQVEEQEEVDQVEEDEEIAEEEVEVEEEEFAHEMPSCSSPLNREEYDEPITEKSVTFISDIENLDIENMNTISELERKTWTICLSKSGENDSRKEEENVTFTFLDTETFAEPSESQEDARFQCHICAKTFPLQFGLNRHLKRHKSMTREPKHK